jgi:3-hydroxymyristoyl/3-hydroxydecanoyl-(acyl carrier protein) dehydratase
MRLLQNPHILQLNRGYAIFLTNFAGGNEKFTLNRIVEKTENSAILEFLVPPASPYFDGHFPAFSILPAVAQIELITRFADFCFGSGIALSEIRRVKFTSIIQPLTQLVLRMEKDNKRIVFKMTSPDGKTVYSSGTLAFPHSNEEEVK